MDDYKEILAEKINQNFNMNIDKSALSSVLSREEFLDLINQYDEEDFSLGDRTKEELSGFFENVTNKKFRITLHNHSTFSDGRLSPEEFILQAVKYADSVAADTTPDAKPPFMIAL